MNRQSVLAALLCVGLCLSMGAEAASRRPVVSQTPPAGQALNTNNGALNGSSSSAGNQDNSGVTITTLLRTDLGGSKAILGPSGNLTSISSEAVGGATPSTAYTQVSASTDLSASRAIQSDLNGSAIGQFGNLGGAEYQRVWLGQASVTGATHAGNNQVLDLLNAGVISGGRWFAWLGTQDGLSTVQFNQYRQERLIWADYPGHFVNAQRYWNEATKLTAQDYDDAANYRRPHRLTIADFSHATHFGSQYLEQQIFLPAFQAFEGGPPLCVQHRYFSNASTAQTNGGAVATLRCLGSFTGWQADLRNLNGSLNTDFAISALGGSGGDATATVVRSSATVLKAGYVDLLVHIYNTANVHKYYRIGIGIGSLTKAANDELNLDGNTFATVWTTDNAGTAAAPTFSTGASRNFHGFAGGATAFSSIMRLKPSDNCTTGCFQKSIFDQVAGLQIFRLATGAIRFTTRDDAAVSFGSLTSGSTCSTGRVDSTCNAKWVLFSANVGLGAGLKRYRLMIVDDVTLHVDYDSGGASGSVSDSRTTFLFNQLGNTGVAAIFWNRIPRSGNTDSAYVGKVARWLMFDKEVDWTVGFASSTDATGATNLGLFRSGAGTLTDLGTASGNIAGDGRTTTITIGATGSFSGSLAPWFGISGNAADFLQGINIGSASDSLPGDEPGNAAKVGGVTWEAWEVRDWNITSSIKGIPTTS